jgi:hypothetical protein
MRFKAKTNYHEEFGGKPQQEEQQNIYFVHCMPSLPDFWRKLNHAHQ